MRVVLAIAGFFIPCFCYSALVQGQTVCRRPAAEPAFPTYGTLSPDRSISLRVLDATEYRHSPAAMPAIATRAPERSSGRLHDVIKGALIGSAVGGALAYLAAEYSSYHARSGPHLNAEGKLTVTLVGMGAGAVVGAVVGFGTDQRFWDQGGVPEREERDSRAQDRTDVAYAHIEGGLIP